MRECPKAEVKRQCFDVNDDKLVLKKTHTYYFQVQLQLLITEAIFVILFYILKRDLPALKGFILMLFSINGLLTIRDCFGGMYLFQNIFL